jgi:hypothetical protein
MCAVNLYMIIGEVSEEKVVLGERDHTKGSTHMATVYLVHMREAEAIHTARLSARPPRW